MNHRVVPGFSSRLDSDGETDATEHLIVEYPLQLILNDQPFTVTMRTPGDDVQLARGLLFSEELIAADQAIDWASTDTCNGTEMRITLPGVSFEADGRTLMSTSSCGLCGKRDLSDIYKKYVVDREAQMRPAVIQSLFHRMQESQEAFNLSGACHAAAAGTLDGDLLCVYEDVGRHNAVDKVVGALLEMNRLHEASILLVSGRVSYEILQKTARAGIPILAAVSAPTALSVNFAAHWGMTLAAFCRQDRMTVYSGQHRLKEMIHEPG